MLVYNPKDQNTSYTPGGLLPPTSSMGYLNEGQSERTSAAGSTFTNGPLGLASNSAGLLSPTTFYVRDPGGGLIGQRTGTTTHYYLFDRLGSVVALTDATGNAVNRYVYDPYGNALAGTTEAVASPWQFAGGFKDAFSGYYKFGARYYDPVIGRWTQPDPSGQDANSYAYSASDPINNQDPGGLDWTRWVKNHSKILIPTNRRTADGRIIKIRLHILDKDVRGWHVNADASQIGGNKYHWYYKNFFPTIGKGIAAAAKLNPAPFIPVPGNIACQMVPEGCGNEPDYGV